MKRSSERILASHCGNLPRTETLETLALTDDATFNDALRDAVSAVVQAQVSAGMDQVNDGEFVKRSGFNAYLGERIKGMERRHRDERPVSSSQWGTNRTGARDQDEFPGFTTRIAITHR